MITAIEFLRRDQSGVYNEQDITHTMIEFAKLHCKAQSEAICDKAIAKENPQDYGTGEIWVDNNSIINAYPLTNIK